MSDEQHRQAMLLPYAGQELLHVMARQRIERARALKGSIKFLLHEQRFPSCAYPGDPGFRRDDERNISSRSSETALAWPSKPS